MSYPITQYSSPLGATLDVAGCERQRQLATTWFELANWRPQGDTYYLANLVTMTDRTAAALNTTLAKVNAVLVRDWTYAPLLTARRQLQSSLATAQFISAAIQNATAARATVVIVPGFKDWATLALNRCASALGEVGYRACMKAEALPGQFAAAVMGDAAAVGGAGLKVATVTGQIVYRIATLPADIVSAVGKVITLATWGGLAYVAYYLFKPRERTKNPRPRPRRRR